MHQGRSLILPLFLSLISLLILVVFGRSGEAQLDNRLEQFQSVNHFEISWITNRIYEIIDKRARDRSLYHLSHAREDAKDDTVDQIIDLSEYNPDDYADIYIHQTTFALGASGNPLIVSDTDEDSLIELAGVWYGDYSIPFSIAAIYEQTPEGGFEMKRLFLDDSLNLAMPFGDTATDLDNDNLPEINFTAFELQGSFSGVATLEADSLKTIPDSLNFMSDSLRGYSGSMRIVDLDNDGLKECIGYKHPRGLFIAEYDPAFNKFKEVFLSDTTNPVYNFAIGDGDQDGKTDFICGSLLGVVYVFENTGDNEYALVWTDTLPHSNADISAATHDIDQNGKPEFFIGNDGYYQNYAGLDLHWYESIADNTYERKRRILISGLGFFRENGLHPHDMDGDDIEDLVFGSAYPNQMFILKWNPNGYFDMHYYTTVSDYRLLDAVTVYRPNGQIIPDIIFSTYYYPELPVHQSHYYKFNPPASIDNPPVTTPHQIELGQNYPNPFNGATTLRFNLPYRSVISLSIYDITGKEVIRLIDHQPYVPGSHKIIWNGLNKFAKEVSSGIYLYELRSGRFRQVKKMLYIK